MYYRASGVGEAQMTTYPITAWLERTRSAHEHGGAGWELGSCLWCPSRDRGGHDRYRIMREPRVGDLVIHCVDSILLGQSVVQTPCVTVEDEPPSPAPWAGLSPYYRIDLRGYRPFATSFPIAQLMRQYNSEILRDIRANAPDRYPFFATAGGSLYPVQGAYLTKCSPPLLDMIREATSLPIDQKPRP
jgi:hypothetical protein